MMSEPEDLIALVTELLTCRNGGHHYCPNCDNGINPERIIKPVKDALAHAATRERQAFDWALQVRGRLNLSGRDEAYARYQQQART